jgi:hypothetical protein
MHIRACAVTTGRSPGVKNWQSFSDYLFVAEKTSDFLTIKTSVNIEKNKKNYKKQEVENFGTEFALFRTKLDKQTDQNLT